MEMISCCKCKDVSFALNSHATLHVFPSLCVSFTYIVIERSSVLALPNPLLWSTWARWSQVASRISTGRWPGTVSVVVNYPMRATVNITVKYVFCSAPGSPSLAKFIIGFFASRVGVYVLPRFLDVHSIKIFRTNNRISFFHCICNMQLRMFGRSSVSMHWGHYFN